MTPTGKAINLDVGLNHFYTDIAILAGVVNFFPHPCPPRTRGSGVRNSQMIQDCYSTAATVPNPPELRKSEKALKQLQKQVSRKKKVPVIAKKL